LQHVNHLSKSQQEGVLSLVKAAHDFDGTPPIAEHVLLHLRHGGDKSDSHLVIEENNEVIAYAHLDTTDLVAGPSVEVVVRPRHRGKGLGALILKEAIKICGDKTRIWSNGDLPHARVLAESNNFTKVRTVIQMSKDLSEVSPVFCDYQIRSFLPDLDNKNWLALNNLAFTNHPEQGNWSEADLLIRLNEDWFDKKGFFVAQDQTELIGFCWTKVHGGQSHAHSIAEEHHDHAPFGEIYVTAVSDKYVGKGVGKALTITGLNYLKRQGLNGAILYVDEDNQIAFNLYKSLGFIESGKNTLYRLK